MPAGVALQPRPPLTSPPSWWEVQGGEAPEEGAPAATAPLPGDWPPLQTVEYMTKLITLGLLLLAIPWLLEQLLSSPARGSSKAASIAGVGKLAV